jgi:hypothetical protein
MKDADFSLDVIQIKTKLPVKKGDELLMNYGPGMLSSTKSQLIANGFTPTQCLCPLHRSGIISEPLWMPDHRGDKEIPSLQQKSEALFATLKDQAEVNRSKLQSLSPAALAPVVSHRVLRSSYR